MYPLRLTLTTSTRNFVFFQESQSSAYVFLWILCIIKHYCVKPCASAPYNKAMCGVNQPRLDL